jgi:hypothetical protein
MDRCKYTLSLLIFAIEIKNYLMCCKKNKVLNEIEQLCSHNINQIFLGSYHFKMYEAYPEINFRFHVEHEVVGVARRGCTAV